MDLMSEAQLLGNLGEFVGAIAVVATLVYVALQVRAAANQVEHTLQATRTQNAQSVCFNFNTWRQMVLDGDNTRIWYQGINDLDALNEGEKQKFFIMAGALDWNCWFMHKMHADEGLLDDVNNHLYRDQFLHPGYRAWLMTHRQTHTDDYGRFLDQVAESVGDERLKAGEFSSLSPGEF
jgi:hypothetical protein